MTTTLSTMIDELHDLNSQIDDVRWDMQLLSENDPSIFGEEQELESYLEFLLAEQETALLCIGVIEIEKR